MMIALYFLAIIGGLVVATAAVVACCLVVESFQDWRHEPHQRSFYEGQQHTRNQLQNDAWWFSESPETMELIQELARGRSVSDVREKWRRDRTSSQSTAEAAK